MGRRHPRGPLPAGVCCYCGGCARWTATETGTVTTQILLSQACQTTVAQLDFHSGTSKLQHQLRWINLDNDNQHHSEPRPVELRIIALCEHRRCIGRRHQLQFEFELELHHGRCPQYHRRYTIHHGLTAHDFCDHHIERSLGSDYVQWNRRIHQLGSGIDDDINNNNRLIYCGSERHHDLERFVHVR